MADVPPPTSSELLRMVTELQQANQRMAEDNQRMQNQIAQLEQARLGHHTNDDENNERTHVSETPQSNNEEDQRNEEAQPENEEEQPDNSAGPFTADIMNFQLPRQFTLPTTLTPYDGLGDPKQHVKKFRSIMIVNGASDPILCRCFPSFLDGPALDWFCSLPADSISRFQELARQFEDHFAASAIYLHDSDYLTTIKQGPQESLKDYITRFTKVAMKIPNLHPEVHLHAIKSGLRPGKFQETIAVAKPKTLAEFREKAKGQIDIEELRQARKAEKSAVKDDEKPRDNKKSFKPVPRYESYTQFNTKRDDIIKEILNSKLIKPPRKAGAYPEAKNVDKTRYCTFHQKHGHTTDECVIAKDLLERLARQGHLDKFITGHMQKRATSNPEQHTTGPSSKEKDKTPAHPRGVINCISGGYAGGGHTSSARKRTYRAMLAVENNPHNPPPMQEVPELTFGHADLNSTYTNYDDPVVISIQLGDLIVRKVLLDPGSSADILFFTTFQKMKLSTNILQPYSGELVGFSGERVPVMGSVWLQTTLGEQPLSKTQDVQYLVVDCFSPYNVILGRPFLNKFTAIVSTFHLCVKFPVQDNIVATIHSDLHEARQCYNISLKPVKANTEVRVNSITSEQPTLAELDPRADFQERPVPNEDLIKVTLTDDHTKFTFIGASLEKGAKEKLIAFLRRNTDLFAWTSGDMPGISPSVITHRLAVNPTARPVSQKKRNLGTEKRAASMSEVNKLIDAQFIRELRFTTWLANIVMQIGRNVEVYVDDMVVKTKVGHPHIEDLDEIFTQVRKYNMRLNPEKCAFGVQGGKFLGFILTSRGIEANPEKCQAILDMHSPKTIKEVQRLTGRLAALSRFLPCLAAKSFNFFQCLKKTTRHFSWNEECEEAFMGLKQFLSKPPVLQKPKLGEPLYLYLSITDVTISSVIIIENNKDQQPVYFVSKSLQNAELRYPILEKLVLALIFSARRLRPYFQSHTIIVRTAHPLRQILSKPELAGRLIKWSIELSEFDIHYQPRGSVKSQCLADFVAELSCPNSDDKGHPWTLFVDGASNPQGSGAGILLESSDGIVIEHSLRFSFKASNNQAEYEALIAGLRRGYSRPLLKCLDRTEADLVLSEAHEGICGIHCGARSLAQKVLRAGFYWPTIWDDSRQKVRTCDKCQKHSPMINVPAEQLHQSEVSWPFNRWGIDILGPFPTAPRQMKYLVVAIDYFSKWIEAHPLAKITSSQMISFVWKSIICRFGVPGHIITDNGRQFTDHSFKEFLQNLKIKQHFSSVEHPQSNGLAEAANKVVLQALRKKLDDAKGLWAELVPEVLWAYNTTAHSTTKETPFRLVYGSEAMIPMEISQDSLRTLTEHHDEARQAELDLIEEIREISAIRHRALQQQLSRRHSRKVQPRTFNTGDLVLRKTEQARRPSFHGKLAAAWDGPYRVCEVLGRGAYKLEQLDGTTIPNTWNINSLKQYYS
ncbi:uncharacterized protein [Arachis hypogaea]|uniref:uncharacterized protein n=1 Tax=Arachis hypogaea TaxID=3818 RepID=UPI003B2177EE